MILEIYKTTREAKDLLREGKDVPMRDIVTLYDDVDSMQLWEDSVDFHFKSKKERLTLMLEQGRDERYPITEVLVFTNDKHLIKVIHFKDVD